jgi:hypothetical protein
VGVGEERVSYMHHPFEGFFSILPSLSPFQVRTPFNIMGSLLQKFCKVRNVCAIGHVKPFIKMHFMY